MCREEKRSAVSVVVFIRIFQIANEMQRENEVLILFLYARCNQVETDGEKFVGRLLEAKLDGQHVQQQKKRNCFGEVISKRKETGTQVFKKRTSK
jgi:hypothetical protein